MSHTSNDLVIVRYSFTQIFNIFHFNDCSHPFCHVSCKLNLMVVHMLIKLMLTRHNNRSLPNLQRHDETGRAP